jgi:tetratricopeptide repeat protein 21B
MAEMADGLSLYERILRPRFDIPAADQAKLREKAALLYRKTADAYLVHGKQDAAINALESSSKLDPGRAETLLILARLHFDSGKRDKCRDVCQQLIRKDASCEEAALMLAEVGGTESVAELETAFLNNPTFYRTLVRFIEKCARSGELPKVKSVFEKCNQSDTGLNFCKGLYYVYNGESQQALTHFGRCRGDQEWGAQALQLIFMIYVNPNRKYVWLETKPLATPRDLDAAGRILERLDVCIFNIDQLRALHLLSQNTTESVNEALALYEGAEKSDFSIILGKCQCFLRVGRQRDATRHLNGIIHENPSHSNFSVFVEAFLMMTYISMKEERFDEAIKYVDKALDLNLSCGKGWELKAVLCEKQGDHKNAAACYREAWRLSGDHDLGIGFRLAYNHMKGNDPVDAIKVCRKILVQHPNYPKLKETILLPCCASLRP